jgi:hypothetical protein
MRGSAFLLCILTAWANLRSSCNQDRPAALAATDDGFAQHASNHCAAAPSATGTGAGAFPVAVRGSFDNVVGGRVLHYDNV